jgi:hypothetical protein
MACDVGAQKEKEKQQNILKRCFNWMGYTLCIVNGKKHERLTDREVAVACLRGGRQAGSSYGRIQTGKHPKRQKIFRHFHTKRTEQQTPSIRKAFRLCVAVIHSPPTISYPPHDRTHSDISLLRHLRNVGHHSPHRQSVTSQKIWILTYTAAISFHYRQFDSWPCQ